LDVCPELLRASKWSAARYGLEAELIDVADKRAIPAHELVEKLLATLRPTLESYGDWDEINSLARDTLARGNGATRQRAAYARRDQLKMLLTCKLQRRRRALSDRLDPNASRAAKHDVHTGLENPRVAMENVW
jgi:gamma-glutamyl:cysteine ligase YbdK (ATP-grasp superfamily)